VAKVANATVPTFPLFLFDNRKCIELWYTIKHTGHTIVHSANFLQHPCNTQTSGVLAAVIVTLLHQNR
jgi:hypothetical protein